MLGCHPNHLLHDHCYEELIGFFKDNASCPLCRKKIDAAKVESKVAKEKHNDDHDGIGIEMAEKTKNAEVLVEPAEQNSVEVEPRNPN